MKKITTIAVVLCTSLLLIASCKKESNSTSNELTNPTNTAQDSVTSESKTYEASGSFTFTNNETKVTKTYIHKLVKVNYKDQSNIWPNTHYTYLSFYDIHAQAAAEMITFVFLGKEMPKSGTYTLGPAGPIASKGISESDKLTANEIAVQVSGNALITQRNNSINIKVTNESGKITIVCDGEFEVVDNLQGKLKGYCKTINHTKTTKKL